MDFQKRYYKVTTAFIMALFLVSISYYQQEAVHQVSGWLCRIAPKSIPGISVSVKKYASPAFKSFDYTQVRKCKHTANPKEYIEIKNI